jgi:hypothetical protein
MGIIAIDNCTLVALLQKGATIKAFEGTRK